MHLPRDVSTDSGSIADDEGARSDAAHQHAEIIDLAAAPPAAQDLRKALESTGDALYSASEALDDLGKKQESEKAFQAGDSATVINDEDDAATIVGLFKDATKALIEAAQILDHAATTVVASYTDNKADTDSEAGTA
jgi:hypothetical protein